MFQCVDCGSQDPWHVCPKHEAFTVKEPGIVMTPRNAEALAEENAKLLLQNDGLSRTLDAIIFSWAELKAATAANVPSGEFREDDILKERVRVAELNLRMLLDRAEKPMTEKQDEESPFPTAQQLKIYRAVDKFFGACTRHHIADCRTCKEDGESVSPGDTTRLGDPTDSTG
jgi:hypothetical protein